MELGVTSEVSLTNIGEHRPGDDSLSILGSFLRPGETHERLGLPHLPTHEHVGQEVVGRGELGTVLI